MNTQPRHFSQVHHDAPPPRAISKVPLIGHRRALANWPLKTVALMLVLIGGFYLVREHWSHLSGAWIYLLLLACPLLHLFHGHGGHGGHGGGTAGTKHGEGADEPNRS